MVDSVSDTKELLAELQRVVGSEYVSCNKVDSIPYMRDAFSPLGKKFFGDPVEPWGVVCPGNTTEVQEIVRIANKFKTPLVPVTFGTNMGAFAVPTVEGSIMVDLKRMDRIIRIDEESMIAIIEPAVSFGRLRAEAEKVGLRCVSKVGGWSGGMVGNFLAANTRPFNARYGWSDPVVSLEVVTGSGEIIETGSQALIGGENSEHVRFCLGPDLVGLWRGSLGSFGIVTKMALRLFPTGEKNALLLYQFDNLETMLAAMKETQRKDLGVSVFGVAADMFYSLMDPTDRMKPEFAKAIRSTVLPRHLWFLIIELCGDRELVDAEQSVADRVCKAHKGKPARFANKRIQGYVEEFMSCNGNSIMHEFHGAQFGFYCYASWSKVPTFIQQVQQLLDGVKLKDTLNPSEDVSVRWIVIPIDRGATVSCGFTVEYNSANAEEMHAMEEVVPSIMGVMLDIGGAFPCTMRALTQMMAEPYRETIYNLKRFLDPNGILAPNKLC